MHTILTAVRRLLSWLAEPEPTAEEALSSHDWADLPTFHPCT
jgi:hypothetical protein